MKRIVLLGVLVGLNAGLAAGQAQTIQAQSLSGLPRSSAFVGAAHIGRPGAPDAVTNASQADGSGNSTISSERVTVSGRGTAPQAPPTSMPTPSGTAPTVVPVPGTPASQ